MLMKSGGWLLAGWCCCTAAQWLCWRQVAAAAWRRVAVYSSCQPVCQVLVPPPADWNLLSPPHPPADEQPGSPRGPLGAAAESQSTSPRSWSPTPATSHTRATPRPEHKHAQRGKA